MTAGPVNGTTAQNRVGSVQTTPPVRAVVATLDEEERMGLNVLGGSCVLGM